MEKHHAEVAKRANRMHELLYMLRTAEEKGGAPKGPRARRAAP
jgi:hypothetical protein